VIFISYSWCDRQVAEDLLAQLCILDVDCWIDSEQLDMTRSIEPQVLAGLRSASAVLLIDSPHSLKSRWVHFEVRAAVRYGRPILWWSTNTGRPFLPRNAKHCLFSRQRGGAR
jgi:TIR domain